LAAFWLRRSLVRRCVSSIRFMSFASSACSREIRLSRICRSASARALADLASDIWLERIMCCVSDSCPIVVTAFVPSIVPLPVPDRWSSVTGHHHPKNNLTLKSPLMMLALHAVLGYTGAMPHHVSTRSVQMSDAASKWSMSLPFLSRPEALNGKMVGDVGFVRARRRPAVASCAGTRIHAPLATHAPSSAFRIRITRRTP
jgi:hypothetical protein